MTFAGWKEWQEITISSEVFDSAREAFDQLLQKLFKKMEQNGSDEGNITLKVDIEIQTEYVPDADGTGRKVHRPVLKHKISTAVPVKDSFDVRKDTEMELVYDKELKRYVLRHVPSGGQQSIFDPEYADIIDGEATFTDILIQDQLPGDTKKMLIGCSDEKPEEGAGSGSAGGNDSDKESQDKEGKTGAGGCAEASEGNEKGSDYEYDPE